MENFLSQLNREQYDAVINTEGPSMVIAGAGAGKTRVLTYKIAYLISKGIDPFNILALTFTNKAAREMKERIIELVGDGEGRNVWMGTFHSVFAKVLRIDGHHLGYPPNYTIYDSDDSKRLIKQIIKDMALDPKTYTPSYISSRISMAKSFLISPEDYARNPEIISADESAQRPLIKDIYKRYNARLRRADAMDFDDLLFNTFVLFRDFRDVLKKYQQKFKYILVDEYQDTNEAQYFIIKKLAAKNENICVVGDDAQSIYAFRGANIRNILNFKKDYPDYKLFKLQQNYRSTKIIVDAANKVIKNNRDQIKKTVWTNNEQGKPIGYIRALSDSEEGEKVAQTIFEIKMNEKVPNSHFAVLYRTNAQSRSLEEALRKMNIPYRIYGGLSFYQRKEIKDIIAYFRLTVNQNDEEALMRAINIPSRGIGKTTLEKINIAATEYNVSMWQVINNPFAYKLNVNQGTLKKLDSFTTMVKSFKADAEKKDAYEAAKKIATASGILKMYRDDDSPEAQNRLENIEELLNAIKEFAEQGAEANQGDLSSQGRLAEFMESVALMTDADKDNPNDNDKVLLMTVHAAKGLEFPYVFVVGLEENLFPSIQSLNTRAELEEERRLFYVAITRAQKRLFLSHAESRYRWGQFNFAEPSRFLDEIDENLLEHAQSYKKEVKKPAHLSAAYSENQTGYVNGNDKPAYNKNNIANPNELMPGTVVSHPKFGTGKILSMEGEGPNKKAVVFFNSAGQKTLLLRFAKLSIIN